MINNPYQGMFGMPSQTDGISSAVSQISGGMDDAYTNRLLGALGLGDVSQYQVQQPMPTPMPFYGSPYGMYNPFMTGMFSPYMQQPMLTSDGREDFNNGNNNTPYQSNAFMRDLAYGLYNMPGSPIANFFGEQMLKSDNRASLASVTGENFRSDGPTGGQAGRDASGYDSSYGDYSGRDSDGWGE